MVNELLSPAGRRQAEGLAQHGAPHERTSPPRGRGLLGQTLGAAALKPDLGRLAEASAPSKERRKVPDRLPAENGAADKRTSIELTAANAKLEDCGGS